MYWVYAQEKKLINKGLEVRRFHCVALLIKHESIPLSSPQIMFRQRPECESQWKVTQFYTDLHFFLDLILSKWEKIEFFLLIFSWI